MFELRITVKKYDFNRILIFKFVSYILFFNTSLVTCNTYNQVHLKYVNRIDNIFFMNIKLSIHFNSRFSGLAYWNRNVKPNFDYSLGPSTIFSNLHPICSISAASSRLRLKWGKGSLGGTSETR